MNTPGVQPSPSGAADVSAVGADRSVCPFALSVTAYGVSAGIQTNDPRILEEVLTHLPPGATRGESLGSGRLYSFIVDAGERSRTTLAADGGVLMRSTLPACLRVFAADLQIHVAEMAPDRLFVHAGVVGYRGRAIVLPGRSYAGKSTLVRELVRAGADYYSDEYAVFDAAGEVHAYPRPLMIRDERGAGLEKQVEPTLRAAGGPLPVGLVVMSEFRSGAEWRPRRLSPGRAALAMLANTVAARRVPEVALKTLHQVVTRVPIVSSERGEASSVVGPIFDLAAQT